MKENADLSICLLVIFAAALVFLSTWMVAWGEQHQDNIAWKYQQLQEKFNNINMSDYTSHEEQMAKVQRTLDYLKDWGWRGYK